MIRYSAPSATRRSHLALLIDHGTAMTTRMVAIPAKVVVAILSPVLGTGSPASIAPCSTSACEDQMP